MRHRSKLRARPPSTSACLVRYGLVGVVDFAFNGGEAGNCNEQFEFYTLADHDETTST